jgi:hypothetical protein
MSILIAFLVSKFQSLIFKAQPAISIISPFVSKIISIAPLPVGILIGYIFHAEIKIAFEAIHALIKLISLI